MRKKESIKGLHTKLDFIIRESGRFNQNFHRLEHKVDALFSIANSIKEKVDKL